MAHPAPSLDEHFAAHGPKRILALDGGGLPGLISLGCLERMERILRERHGNDPSFRLSHYFDLIAGTSSGAIIAAFLAQGLKVEEVIHHHQDLAESVARPEGRPLTSFLRQRLGPAGAIGDPDRLRTGLLVMGTQRDTGRSWPISNNPKGPCFLHPPAGEGPPQRDLPLWQVVDASVSTAISTAAASLHNNPALQAYWLATLKGFGLRWPVGPGQLLIVSVGAGQVAPQGGVEEGAVLVESLMQGMGQCLTAPRWLDPGLGDLSPHELVGAPRFSYARYDAQLALGRAAVEGTVNGDAFPAAFDLPLPAPAQALPPPQLAGEIRPYRKREGTAVMAIQLKLDMDAFTYRKWGGLQTCKSGDWIVDRNGSVHTVDAETFARTYKQVGPATYVKQGQVWAAPARSDGAITTKEGVTHYKQGDVLVWNDKECKDGYAIAKDIFPTLYEPIPPSVDTPEVPAAEGGEGG
jgi:hypothetical protein